MSSFPIIDAEARYLPIPDDLKTKFSPAGLAVFEWRDYFFQFPNSRQINVNGKNVAPIASGLFRMRWENTLGLSEIKAEGEAPFWVEVLSPKFPTPEAHYQFLSVILNDLFARSRHLTWHFEGETKRAFERSQTPPTPLEILDFLLRFGEKLELLLSHLLKNPPINYITKREIVLAHEATQLDGIAVADLTQNMTRWGQTNRKGRFGYALPQQLSQSKRVENFDSVEIRLASKLCATIQQGLGKALRSRYFHALSEDNRTKTSRLEKLIRNFTGRFPVQEPSIRSSDIRSITARDLANLIRELRGTGAPVFAPIQRFANLRDIASLWEFWSFFALVEAIEATLGQRATLKAAFDESRGLLVPSKAIWDEWSLVFNGPTLSYSTPLRPDFLWFRGTNPIAAFDAKFRTDAENQGGKGADLHKMHAYCDALNIGAAIALHPGINTTFFDRERGPLTQVPLHAILQGAAKGVGLWGARPSQASE
jgi:hypothetical protein